MNISGVQTVSKKMLKCSKRCLLVSRIENVKLHPKELEKVIVKIKKGPNHY